ncbi:MAG: hypothetical protein M0Z70_03250 [Nitrospiraceae bacterium]|nr:hypothetical protein [Nitrospiraceae bacterium]
MQYSVVKIIYHYNGHDNSFPRWIVGNEDFGAFADDSEDKVIDFLIENKVSPDDVGFEYVDEKKPDRADFENMFREKFRTKLKGISG